MTTEDIENYRKTVDSTSDRLLKLCEYWSREIAENEKNLSEEVTEKINSVIGKTQLLRNSKFKQFSGFLNDAEQKTIGKPVKLDDIRGFWETIYLQVDQVDNTFRELDKLKSANYVTESFGATTVPDGSNHEKKAMKKTQPPVKKPVVSASSNLKSFISAQRERKKTDQNGDSVVTEKISSTNGH